MATGPSVPDPDSAATGRKPFRMREIFRGHRILDPMDRLSEALFGLIMVLSITGSLSVAQAGHSEVRSMLISALGCNIAWGIVDAVMYILARLAEQGRNLGMLRALRAASEPDEARRLVADVVPPGIASVVKPDEWDAVIQRLKLLEEPPGRSRLSAEDWLGALGVFLVVFLATLPVVVPFLLITGPQPALRTSNAVAVILLFILGVRLGQYAGYPSLRMGLWMVLIGLSLVGITIALGG